MIEVQDKKMCCGCHACAQVCPVACIHMTEDEEGFLYPNADANLCIQCGKCEQACQYIHPFQSAQCRTAWACKSNDMALRKQSSSGGVFSLLAEHVLGQGGVVFGAYLDSALVCRHGYAETLEDYKKFRGSKYVQSIIGDAYKDAQRFLKEGRLVLFTGTPCQIAGLQHFLSKPHENLLTADIICHGTPSGKVLHAYTQELSAQRGTDVSNVEFRTKEGRWSRLPMSVTFSNGTAAMLEPDDYIQGFLQNLYLRPSCHNCAANRMRSGSDLTMADYWGLETKFPDFDDGKGVSLVLVKTEQGEAFFSQIQNKMTVRQTSLEHASIFQLSLTHSASMNENRAQFFDELKQGRSFSELSKKYVRSSTVYKIRKHLDPKTIRRMQYLLYGLKSKVTRAHSMPDSSEKTVGS